MLISMTSATAERLEHEIASLRNEVAELRTHVVHFPIRDEEQSFQDEMALWDRASLNDFNVFAIKNKI